MRNSASVRRRSSKSWVELMKPARTAGRAQGVDLVLHEGDQRGDDDAGAGAHHGRDLVAEGLAATGGHEDDRVAAADQVVDDGFLVAAEGVVPEDGAQGGERVPAVVDRGLAAPLGEGAGQLLAGAVLTERLVREGLVAEGILLRGAAVEEVVGEALGAVVRGGAAVRAGARHAARSVHRSVPRAPRSPARPLPAVPGATWGPWDCLQRRGPEGHPGKLSTGSAVTPAVSCGNGAGREGDGVVHKRPSRLRARKRRRPAPSGEGRRAAAGGPGRGGISGRRRSPGPPGPGSTGEPPPAPP